MPGLLDLQLKIEKYFEFLKTDFGFKGPFYWNLAYEQEYTFINGQYYLNIGFDGGFFVSVGKTNELIPDLSTGKMTLKDVKYKERKSIELFNLLSEKEKIDLKNIKNPSDELHFWSKIVKANSEILQGNWFKFSIKYKLKKYFSKLLFR